MKKVEAKSLGAVHTHTHTLHLENKKIGSKENLKNRNARLEVKNKERGITLIALVITIIVLLILAGVSISMLTGENGILTQASNAKKATEESTEQEKRQLSQVEASTHLENYIYTDAEGAIAKIPAGFAVSNVEGENLVSKGLVIIGSTGNEYVWIPCTEKTYKREENAWVIDNDNGSSAIKDELTLIGMTTSEEENKNGITLNVLDEIVAQVNNEIESVKTSGGYYIGRYEVGKESEKAVIKQNKEPYTNILWSRAYQDAKEIYSGNEATSYLCSSYAWDTAIKFIQTHSIATNYGTNTFNENLPGLEVKDKKGNIIKKANEAMKLKTGSTTPQNNIFDMGGNLAEFTTEINPSTPESIIIRGGGYDFRRAAGARWDYFPSINSEMIGFRTTLFIK